MLLSDLEGVQRDEVPLRDAETILSTVHKVKVRVGQTSIGESKGKTRPGARERYFGITGR